MLDENSALIVEIIQLNNSVKHERGAQLADVQDKLDKKRKKLNRNLMTLAKWADESTEPPVKSAPRPQVHAPPAHIAPQQPVASNGVTVPLNVPEPIVVAPQTASAAPDAAAPVGSPTSPVKPEVRDDNDFKNEGDAPVPGDDSMGAGENAANNDTEGPSSTSEPAQRELESQPYEADETSTAMNEESAPSTSEIDAAAAPSIEGTVDAEQPVQDDAVRQENEQAGTTLSMEPSDENKTNAAVDEPVDDQLGAANVSEETPPGVLDASGDVNVQEEVVKAPANEDPPRAADSADEPSTEAEDPAGSMPDEASVDAPKEPFSTEQVGIQGGYDETSHVASDQPDGAVDAADTASKQDE
ncbi:hypothetical protein DYB32_002566 [Aphanomyces invadans]|uniref:SS18 N-terminal domain-containing protein n=1 Tax=Aphanomyces invadans TaxID=157072 RepID=A0A418B304_9STRA|nr:hypothetical protein DYB32_002566 [Aphanomyces invadans]